VPATRSGSDAYVIFPDDFEFDEVQEGLGRLRKLSPSALAVLVTNTPLRYATTPARDGSPVVLPKPAWGWTILETIRDRMGA
jgi:hypothetical protein